MASSAIPRATDAAPLLGESFCSLDGALAIPCTARGEAARAEILRKLQTGAYPVEESPCLCGASNDRVVATVDRYRLPHRTVICLNCSLIRTSPRMTQAAYGDFYARHYRALYERHDHDEAAYYTKQGALAQQRADFVLARVVNRSGAPLSVVEIGCGGGWNLAPFAAAGWKAVGWDMDGDYLASGQKRLGLDLRLGALEDALSDGARYDLVILSHVVEHFLDPIGDLRRLRSLLKPSGLLFIEVPNVLEVGAGLGRYWQNAHTYSFTPATLSALMGAAGFDRVDGDAVIRSLWRSGAERPFEVAGGPPRAREMMSFLERRQHTSVLYQRYRGLAKRFERAAARFTSPPVVAIGSESRR